MGMDVFGKEPITETGEYFRNNVWWWRGLWDYCVKVAPELCDNVSGQTNDGDGLDADGAIALAEKLQEQIDEGFTAKYEHDYNAWRASLPRVKCNICDGTGIRTDEVGIENGMPMKELAIEVQILTGRIHGWCNGCDGEGDKESFEASYPFSTENVQQFANFLTDSGGFSIC